MTLNNRRGNAELVDKEQQAVLSILGVELETVEKEALKKLQIEGGVQVKRLYAGKLRRKTNMREGFIITKVDEQAIDSVNEFIKILEQKEGGVMLEGIYDDIPGKHFYAFGM